MKNFPYKSTLRRYNFLAICFAILGVAIVAKAAYIMFVERSFWQQVSERNVKENVIIPASRGNILSADGQLLATSSPDYKVYIDFRVTDKDSLTQIKAQFKRDSLFEAKIDSLSTGLHLLFPSKSSKWFKKHLYEGYRKKSRHWAIYPNRISYLDYKELLKLPFLNRGKLVSGVHQEEFYAVKKPFGSLAARTLGDTYPGKDSARSGLQLAFDSLLRGKPGISHRQKVLNKWLGIVDEPPVEGADIITTIDVKMQDFAEKALKDKMKEETVNGIEGVVLLMEVETGDVKAIVNLSKCSDGEYRERKNTAVSNLMEPGSVFKPMSFLVAFNDGKLSIDDKVNCCGGVKKMYKREMTDHNWRKGGYGTLTASQCLEQSSNIGVSVLIDNIYHKHPEKFVDGLYKLGVAEDLHLDIPGYTPPVIRRPKKDKTGKHWANWYDTALPWMSIGYETQVPPISVLNFYNGIANNGRMMRPRLVTCAMRNGEIIKEYPPQVIREQMASPRAIKDLQICLRRVVSIGLGKKAGSHMFSVSGKTGTAQVWEKGRKTAKFLVSFAGYFPSEKPKYSCMVCILKYGLPASGGGQCGPVFKKIAEMVMRNTLKPDFNASPDTLHKHLPYIYNGSISHTKSLLSSLNYGSRTDFSKTSGNFMFGQFTTSGDNIQAKELDFNDKLVPDVIGFGARDAVFYLESLGLKVTLEGFGAVQQQSLPFGHIIVKGERIHLKLETGKKPEQTEDFPTEISDKESNSSDSVKKETTPPLTPQKNRELSPKSSKEKTLTKRKAQKHDNHGT